ncbi:MAG: DUF1211 domain-containing protein [Actinomycetales bacterium]|nr:DUF1211 domain-containing protein [Actinomycetales bacterium]
MTYGKALLRTPRGIDRFIFFTDAVVAVAITLLVLPLVDAANNIGQATSGEYLVENGTRIFAFVLSFAVIGRLWIAHHQFSEVITDYSVGTLWLNMAWMLTIVFLPVPTELISSEADDFTVANGVYILTMLANMSIMLWLRHVYLKNPSMMTPEGLVRVREGILGMRVNIILLVIALVLSVTVAPIGLYALMLLVFGSPITRLIRNRGWRERTH